MKKISAFILLFLFCCTHLSFAISMDVDMDYGSMNVPEPRLIYPSSDRIDISGQTEVEFRWSPQERAAGFRDYYDLRIYEGYDMVESALIFQKDVAPNEYSLALPARNFVDGKVYTWSLRQVYRPSRKSRRSFQSFRVRKDASNALPQPLVMSPSGQAGTVKAEQ